MLRLFLSQWDNRFTRHANRLYLLYLSSASLSIDVREASCPQRGLLTNQKQTWHNFLMTGKDIA